MLIKVEELKTLYSEYDFSKFNDARLELKLKGIENAIRKYTHNSFMNRNTITECKVVDGYLVGDMRYFNIGDTIEIYNGNINDGLYVIEDKNDDTVMLDRPLYDCDELKIVKIEYPQDVIEGSVDLLDYDLNYRKESKKGIASETLSRHSVSYVQLNASNVLNGYPAHLLGFLQRYVRWKT